MVRVSAPPSVCALWLMPRLAVLEAGTPPLRIVLQVEHRKVDFEEEGVDLGIRCGRGGAPDRLSLKLFEEWCFPIASPQLAKAIGEGAPERLLAQPLIHELGCRRLEGVVCGAGARLSPAPAGSALRGL